MKKVISFLSMLALLIAFAGCAGRRDSFTFIYQKAGLPNLECMTYEVNIGNKLGGATIAAELWKNGECAESAPLTLNKETKEINISLFMDNGGTAGNTKGLNVQIGSDAVSGSVLTYFELPQNVLGYSFTAYKDKEIINVNAGEEILLGAMPFDTGAGVRTVDCKRLLDEPEKVKDYSCLLLLRASFTAEQIDPQAEAPAGTS